MRAKGTPGRGHGTGKGEEAGGRVVRGGLAGTRGQQPFSRMVATAPPSGPPPTGEPRSGALPSVPPPGESGREILTQLPPTQTGGDTHADGAWCRQHMAPTVTLGNTSDCHVMRRSVRCWGHTTGRAAHSPYLLLNRICTHSRSVLMSSVSFMKASHFSIKTQGVQVRARRSRDPMAWLPLASLSTPTAADIVRAQPVHPGPLLSLDLEILTLMPCAPGVSPSFGPVGSPSNPQPCWPLP